MLKQYQPKSKNMEKHNIQNELQQWAEKAVGKFNELSKETGIGYYQQSPLDIIYKPIETLICGINPGSGSSAVCMTPEKFLEGNEEWENRFVSDEENATITKDWAKFFGGVHYFVCGDQLRHNKGFDDDAKTVWTNLTPFATPDTKGLGVELYEKTIPYTLDLIKILRPKKIILLGFDTFDKILRYGKIEKGEVIAIPIVKDKIGKGVLEVGSIYDIPTIQQPHPSRSWKFHNFFMPIFVKMWSQIIGEKKSIGETAEKIKAQLTRLEPIE